MKLNQPGTSRMLVTTFMLLVNARQLQPSQDSINSGIMKSAQLAKFLTFSVSQKISVIYQTFHSFLLPAHPHFISPSCSPFHFPVMVVEPDSQDCKVNIINNFPQDSFLLSKLFSYEYKNISMVTDYQRILQL